MATRIVYRTWTAVSHNRSIHTLISVHLHLATNRIADPLQFQFLSDKPAADIYP